VATRAASVLVLEVAKQRAVEAARQRLQGDFLLDLLAGNFPSEDALRARARWLGHDLSRPHRVIVLGVDPRAGDNRDVGARNPLADAGWLAAAGARSEAIMLLRDGRLVVLLPVDAADADQATRVAAEGLRRE